ncbi:hypothetical protein C8046_11400 [Serinibacter arcticus]|uniref:AAA+ ATPase domain-containing protein n=1 Tax=Serinibacter arcticus TaxID=1655435 RepID=A0A2U1ZW13_9MICO|nr:NB-ARC domain-containing protein [Serinibacter arcticus]PWD51161.1 hypothetical protein C8046_11400 [Serinibacter arcticus]
MHQGELEQVRTLDDLVRVLQSLRTDAGEPSFATIATAVTRLRADRRPAVPAARPGRVTIYDAFRTGRRRLDPELLLDIVAVLGRPDLVGPVREAHTRVLRHRIVAHARPRLTVVGLGAPLPHEPISLADRSADAARLAALLLDTLLPDDEASSSAPSHTGAAAPGEGLAVVILTGMPGVGKTTLAREVARCAAAGSGAPSVLEVGLRTASGDDDGHVPLPPHDLAREITTALRATAAAPGGSSPSGSTTTAVRRTHPVVLLDDVPTDADLAGVLDRLPGGTIVVVTSRRRLTWPRAVAHHEVEGLTPADTTALVSRLLGPCTTPEGPAEDAAALEALAVRTGALPLAIAVLAGQASKLPGWYLSDHAQRLDSVASGLLPALEDAYDGLPAAGREVLHLLARHPGRLDVREVAVALQHETTGGGTDPATDPVADPAADPLADAAAALESLRADNLVRRDDDGRHDLHDAVREIAARRALEQVSRSEHARQTTALARDLAHRAALAWRRSASTQAPEGSAGPATEDPIAWLERHVEVTVTTTQLAAELDLPGATAALGRAILPYLVRSERFSDAYLVASSADGHHDRTAEVEDLLMLARAARLVGRFDEARAVHDRLAAAGHATLELRMELGESEAMVGSMEQAVADLESVLAETTPADPLWGAVAYKLPQMLLLVGRAEDARQLAEEVIARLEDTSVTAWTIVVRSNLARALRELDDPIGSERIARTCLDGTDPGTRRFALLAETVLADALDAQGRASDALAVAEAAHAEAVALDDTAIAAVTGCALAKHLCLTGHDDARAADVVDGVGLTLRAFSYPAIEIDYLVARGRLAARTHRATEGRRTLQRALVIAGRSGLRIHENDARLALGDLELADGEAPAAREVWTAVLADPATTPYGHRLAAERLARLDHLTHA